MVMCSCGKGEATTRWDKQSVCADCRRNGFKAAIVRACATIEKELNSPEVQKLLAPRPDSVEE